MLAIELNFPYSEFIFESYAYNRATSSLALRYRYSGGPSFEEILTFDESDRHLSATELDALDRVFRLIFLLSGVSYYKAFVPPALICEAFALDQETASLIKKVYRKGLAEFAFRNRLDLEDRLQFRCDNLDPVAALPLSLPRRTCVPVGGGKDSIVTLECLKRSPDPVILFSLGTAEPISRTIAIAQLPFFRIRRSIDRHLFAINETGALNGHVPITAILSAIATASAIIYGFDTIAMSNEHSASAPNIKIGGLEINHQYSKSIEFEDDFAKYISNQVSPDIKYFSLLRPLSEIAIAQRFSRHTEYFRVFRSCNKAFTQIASQWDVGWCCNCPKCRFVFLALAPFVSKEKLIEIFGTNLLNDNGQLHGFSELCGLRAYKPFECVGEIGESSAVLLHLADKPEWRSDIVVRRLLPDLALALNRESSYLSLFERKFPHRVPEVFLGIFQMRVNDLSSKRVAIWGLGREGRAAIRFIRSHHPKLGLIVIDEAPDTVCPDEPLVECVLNGERIAQVLDSIDVIVKSPGVSLHHPMIKSAQNKGVAITSLMNLWFAKQHEPTTICVTGSKGKSTTASLIAHALASLGSKVDLVGNVGVPLIEANVEGRGHVVMEVSSYQAADFTGTCDIGVLTSIHPEHLDWHGSLAQYFKDKFNLLARSKIGIVNIQAMNEWSQILGVPVTDRYKQFNTPDAIHFVGDYIYKEGRKIGEVPNPYIRRHHNMSNLCAALTVVEELKLDVGRALASVENFRGLPHRQQDLGEIDGRVYVDDSISTTSDSAMAALATYSGRRITIILGGFDRHLDYSRLVESIVGGSAHAVVCLGDSGARIYEELHAALKRRADCACDIYKASTMNDAVSYAKRVTPLGGVVLLSPAAASYGSYRSFVERGRDFAEKAGLPNPFYHSIEEKNQES